MMDGLDKLSEVVEENLDFIQKCFEGVLSGLEYKEKELDIQKESVSGRFREVDLARESVERRLLQVMEKEKELQFLQEKGLRDFELTRKEVDSVLEGVKVREDRLNDQEKLVRGFFNRIELEIKKFESIQKSMEEMFGAISLKERQVENCWRELKLIGNEIERKAIEIREKEGKLEAQRKNFELREEALALRNKELVNKENEIELKERGLNFRTGEKNKRPMFRDGGKGGRRLPKVDAADPTECRELRIKDKKRARRYQDNEVNFPLEGTLHTNIAERNAVNKFREEYPDPEFHDFDMGRKASCFAVDQFWACYDNVDLLPRFYVHIKKVYSQKSQLHVNWLEVDPGCRRDVDSLVKDLPIACGKFLCGNSEDIAIGSCSHQIHCEENRLKGYYMIYPGKGEIWALFKDLAVRKTSNSGSNDQYDYEIVVVLSDFVEIAGIRVAYLDKLEGYVSLFQRKKENTSFLIRPNQLFRFSHRIPSYQMTGTEREGVPGGCFELDPASLPTKMLPDCSPYQK